MAVRHHLTVRDDGQRNVILIAPGIETAMRGSIIVKGSDNRIVIGPGCQATDLYMEIGSSCSVTVGHSCGLGNLFVYASQDNIVEIGDNTGFGGTVRLLLHEPGGIKIGAGCLFASEIDVSISDMHSIIDTETGRRVNPAANVLVEDRVWIGVRAMLLKGSHVQEGSIVGARAVVCGLIPKNSVAAGSPARV
ncbi:MAG TPA: acyltransferase, partial [Bradyrhizobium sp.]